MAYQVLQSGGPLPARCVADPFPFGAWPVPADAVAMAIPCCDQCRRSGSGYRELTGCCRLAGSPDPVPGRDMATGCASMARDGRRRPGRAWPAPAAADPGHAPGRYFIDRKMPPWGGILSFCSQMWVKHQYNDHYEAHKQHEYGEPCSDILHVGPIFHLCHKLFSTMIFFV